MKRHKVIRITTVPISMNKILVGQLAYLNQFYEVIGVSSFVEKDFQEIEEREGIRMIDIPMVRTINFRKDIIALKRLVELFKKEKPDIVHTHTPKAGLLGMIASKIAGVPVRLHTVGGMPLMETKGIKLMILRQTEKLTYKLAHRIYPNSTGLATYIIENKFTNPEKIKVIANGSSNGIDLEYYKKDFPNSVEKANELRESLGYSKSDFIFCFVGRLAKEKGIEELVEAFLKLKQEKPTSKIKLLLIGTLEQVNGPVSEETVTIINNSEDIKFPGRTDDVRLYLQMIDALILPTYREGFPNILLQAGAMSVPVIATDINGCNEIIDPNKNGLLIKVKDTTDLYEKMKYMYEEEQVRIDFGKAIRKKVEQKFNNKLVWESLKQEYDYWVNLTVKNKNSSD